MNETSKDSTGSSSEGYPLLNTIESPADLRKLPVESLPAVCADIRRFLIDTLSKNPGHFASSMGAVDITVALHYVFNTPYDRIVWDVGHQAYGHKLLTGRRDKFYTNRTLNGLSGFPNPEESDYDTFMAGHASNSISAALGMAVATQMKHEMPERHVVAVIGDASISGGLAFEGINNAANTPNNLLIILNDNNMSIDANVGSLHSYLAHITTSRRYNDLRNCLYKLMKRLHLVSDRRKGAIMRFNNSLKALLSREQNIFEGLNIRYFGPIDGHDVGEIVRVLNDIKDMTGPKILHIKTKKGKGFPAAELDPSTWHAPGRFNPETGEIAKSSTSATVKYQHVFGTTLLELAQMDPSIVGITAAMAPGTSMSILKEAMPTRVFDVGISEEHAVTFAGGLAKEGLRPVVAIYSSFLQRGYDQIIHDVAIQRLPVIFCLDRAGIVGEDGVTHHGLFDIAYMRTIPGMVVSSPRDEQQLRDLMFTAHCYTDGPFTIRYPRGKGKHPDWHTPMKQLPIGKSELIEEGNEVAVISTGPIFEQVSEAVKRAKAEGMSVAQYNIPFIKPLDKELMQRLAADNIAVVTVEDGTTIGGLGSAIAESLAEYGHHNAVHRLGVDDEFVAQGTVPELYRLCGIDAESIFQTIKSFQKQ